MTIGNDKKLFVPPAELSVDGVELVSITNQEIQKLINEGE